MGAALGTFQILRNHLTGWVDGFRYWPVLLTNSTQTVGGLENPPNVIFEWSLTIQLLRVSVLGAQQCHTSKTLCA